MSSHIYTHRDEDGIRWRFEGMRPISELADEVMNEASPTFKINRWIEQTDQPLPERVRESITCLRCGRTSHSPDDVREHYCGHCHLFHDDARSAEEMRIVIEFLNKHAPPAAQA